MLTCICHDNNTIPKDRFKDKNEITDAVISEELKQLIIRSFKI